MPGERFFGAHLKVLPKSLGRGEVEMDKVLTVVEDTIYTGTNTRA